jgi:hypothetical protein
VELLELSLVLDEETKLSLTQFDNGMHLLQDGFCFLFGGIEVLAFVSATQK